jgi:thiol-disulfide isomerase/thioredoxin
MQLPVAAVSSFLYIAREGERYTTARNGEAGMHCTRRAVIGAAAGSLFVNQAHAQQPDWLREHPAMSVWDAPARPAERLLNARIEPEEGARMTVREWLGGRPTVLAVWATWCPPCLAEKADEAYLSDRLVAANSRAQIKALQAFDRATLTEARQRLQTLRASSLETRRAEDSAEQALLWTFGFERDRRSMQRTSNVFAELSTALPFTLLIDANGALLGTMTGRVTNDDGEAYWRHPSVFDLMQRLAG